MGFEFLLSLIFSQGIALAQPTACPRGLTEFAPGTESVELKNCVQIKKASLSQLKLDKVSVNHSVLNSVAFFEVITKQGTFIGTRFDNSHFRRWRASHLDFDKTLWQGGTVKDSDFSGTSFHGAQLRGTRWYNTDLTGARISNAQISNCFFQDVNFENTDLRGTRFENCIYLGVSFHGAIFNKDTVLPFSNAEKAQKGMVYRP